MDKDRSKDTWLAAWGRIPRRSKIMFFIAFLLFTLPEWSKLYKGVTGQFVVATNEIGAESMFNNSVVYILDNGFKGAGGLVLNRRLSPEQMDHLPNFIKGRKINIFWGGPVMFPDVITVIQYDPKTGRVTVIDLDDKIKKDPDFLDKTEHQIGSDEPMSFPRFYVGAAVWGPLQLERERHNAHWLTGQPEWKTIANEPEDQYWPQLRQKYRDASRIGSRRSL